MGSALSGSARLMVRVLLPLSFLIAARADAQIGSDVVAFDFGVGPALGSGRLKWKERSGAGFSMNLSWRPEFEDKRKVVFALNSAGFVLPYDEQTLCIGKVGNNGKIVPCTIAKAPDAISLGALGGIAIGENGSGVRVMAGPALFRAREQDNSVGLQSRVDFATPMSYGVSFVIWAQGMLIPLSTEDHTAKALIVGVGFRLR